MKRQIKKQYLILTVILLIAITIKAQDKITIENWKFHVGDNMQWSKPSLDDKEWQDFRVDVKWDKQGYVNHEGYGWYRARFFLPSTIKNNNFLKDSIKLYIGKIDECDQVFINGVLIGQNAGFKTTNFEDALNLWNVERCYRISANNQGILWDKENVIAIRVYNSDGEGGIFDAKPRISMIDINEYITINTDDNRIKYNVDKTFNNQIMIKSSYKFSNIEGKLLMQLKSNDDTLKVVWGKTIDITLAPLENKVIEQKNIPFIENTFIVFNFTEKQSKKIIRAREEIPYILTPQPFQMPRINGAKVFGVRPGNPFLFTVVATGKAPVSFSAEWLPKGLTLDKITGKITGSIAEKGVYIVKLTAENSLGKNTRNLKIVCGDLIALTPPMGWNSWNCWAVSVSEAKVKKSTDAMVSSGLINHGWTYINIDDGWELVHKEDSINSNSKFPNIKLLADYVHSKGLKLGIYSSPGSKTCDGYEASFLYEIADARNYSAWGIDYLKYDWCSYYAIPCKGDTDYYIKPYRTMQKALSKVRRDIVYSLCQYGMGDVWKWGASVNGNLWRTTYDINDSWKSLTQIGFSQDKCSAYAKPGHWNDPDMLVVGRVGWGPSLHNSHLTPSEQYMHLSLWALLSAPLLVGCDLNQLDDFTLNLLTNDEVLDIDQDPLGKEAIRVIKTDDYQVWVKLLEDGTQAVGIFNLSSKTKKITLNWSDLNLTGTIMVRDVWRQIDLGKFKDKFEASVYSHGVVLIKIKNAN